MRAGLELTNLHLPRARLLSREPYVVAVFMTNDGTVKHACEPLHGVKRNRPFQGQIEVMPEVEVEHIAGRIEIWESDQRPREIGERVTAAVQSGLGQRLLDAAGGVTIAGARVSISLIFALIGKALHLNKDDRLASFDVEAEADEVEIGQAYTFTSPRAVATFVVTGEDLTGWAAVTDGFELPSGASQLLDDAVIDWSQDGVGSALADWIRRDGTLDGLDVFIEQWRTIGG